MSRTMKTMVALLAVLALVASACGAAADKISEEAAQKAAEKLIEASSDGDVSVDISGDGDDATVKVETEDGSMSFGAGSEMPEGLEIPVPDGGVVQTSFSGSDGIMVSIAYDGDRYEEIVAFYDDWTAGSGDDWQKQTLDMSSDGETYRNTVWVVDGSDDVINVGDCTAVGSDDMEPNSVCLTVGQG